MGYFLLEVAVFIPGVLALLTGNVPLTRRRVVRGSVARLMGIVLMLPLPLYLIACKRSNVPPLGSSQPSLDPLMPETEGFVRLAAVLATVACLLVAIVLALVTSERRRR